MKIGNQILNNLREEYYIPKKYKESLLEGKDLLLVQCKDCKQICEESELEKEYNYDFIEVNYRCNNCGSYDLDYNINKKILESLFTQLSGQKHDTIEKFIPKIENDILPVFVDKIIPQAFGVEAKMVYDTYLDIRPAWVKYAIEIENLNPYIYFIFTISKKEKEQFNYKDLFLTLSVKGKEYEIGFIRDDNGEEFIKKFVEAFEDINYIYSGQKEIDRNEELYDIAEKIYDTIIEE